MSQRLSPHFTRDEFECSCGCGFDTVDTMLLITLELIREKFNVPVKITSGARCRAHNEKVGGKPGSKHLVGKAADFKVKGFAPSVVQEWIRTMYPDTYGVGKGASFTHLDVRENRADWGY